MLIKVLDDHGKDKHLVECKRIHWPAAQYLECFADAKQSEPCVTLKLASGDRVYIMNDEGQTVDSKRVGVIFDCEGCRGSGFAEVTIKGQAPVPCTVCGGLKQ